MNIQKRIYVAIDLKSFYASVECVERNLDPLTTNLVVADASRSKKTICLAISPSLKKYGLPGRARLFEVVKKVQEINLQRSKQNNYLPFDNESYDDNLLQSNPHLKLSYIIATPRMAFYIEYSTRIYGIYLKYVSPDDIHVYSIDEVFIDITDYLKVYALTPREFVKMIILDILKTTGITATAGIGTNLYLCKIAMDIVAKHIKADQDGVRIAQLDEMRYRKYLWNHQPITDFWRVGKGYANKLKKVGLYTMGDIAKCSIGKADEYYNEDLLYDLFGINAELLIDHAWGYEPCTIKDIKNYKPLNNSIGSGQVLDTPYDFNKAKLVVKEMIDLLSLELVDKGLVTNQIVLTIGYDIENLSKSYHGEIVNDMYGRKIPKHAQGRINLPNYSASLKILNEAIIKLYNKIIDKNLTVRRINISLNHVISELEVANRKIIKQLDIFTDYETLKKQEQKENERLLKEKKLQEATLKIKNKYGKNAILKGMNLSEGAKTKERNKTIGGHKA